MSTPIGFFFHWRSIWLRLSMVSIKCMLLHTFGPYALYISHQSNHPDLVYSQLYDQCTKEATSTISISLHRHVQAFPGQTQATMESDKPSETKTTPPGPGFVWWRLSWWHVARKRRKTCLVVKINSNLRLLLIKTNALNRSKHLLHSTRAHLFLSYHKA